jgi:hypothetical protein
MQNLPAIIAIAIPIYFITIFIFDLLLRGFVPFIPSRPWVIDEIMSELELGNRNKKFIALSTGRSGFMHVLEKKYPEAEIIAIEPSLFPFLVSKLQILLRHTKIKVHFQKIPYVDVSDADFVYSHLYPDEMEGLGPKLKFECKTGAKIVSTGFNIARLKQYKIVELTDRKGRLDFLSKNQKLFQRKSKRYKKEKKAFFYEI